MKTQLTKEIYLKEKVAGKGNAQIERDWGLKPNSLYPLLKKWDVTGAKTEPQKQADVPPSTGIIINPGIHGADALEATLIQHPAVDPKLTAILNYVRELAGPDPRSAIFEQIAAERQRQDSLDPLFQLDMRMEVLVEEIGELAQAKLVGNRSAMRKELIELASCPVRWIETLDKVESKV